MVPVPLMLVSKVVGMGDEPPIPLGKGLVVPTGPNPLEPDGKVGRVGVAGRLVGSLTLGTPDRELVAVALVGSLTLGTPGRELVAVALAEVVVNGLPMPVDDVLGTPVPLLLTGLVPDAIVPDVKGA